MKSEKESRQVIVEIFTCEFCGKKSNSSWEISSCEKKHKIDSCDHLLTYEIEDDYDSGTSLYSYCAVCHNRIKEFTKLEYYDIPSDILKPVYDWLCAKEKAS